MSELQDIHNKLADFETRMTTVEGDSKQVLGIVTEIKMGLLGSKQLDVEGVVQKVSRHEKCLDNLSKADIINKTRKHEKYIEADKKQKWMIYGGVLVIGAIYTFLSDFWDKIFHRG